MLPGFRKKTDIWVKENEGEIDDSLVQIYTKKKLNFLQVENWREILELEDPDDKEFISIYLSVDKEYSVFERKVMTFADLLGNLGGLYEIGLIVGSLTIGIFSERLFVSSIIHKIYQLDKDRDENYQHD